ncbi:uncharacterized protein SPAPADRAFT_63627 [Spathaspora passalidarum NRRL Y-27907]|uniref:D-serine dehydratase n=1 Tax=Spathaspora passalidarum (strain NRRL Y-27907 / 11-Y1) TaxID=619300 RepID=G3AVV5_SPAPN|nr:uncharacterized protein SPAPADRAFT_63627 [Spathaspora passalidarum NRRL Y-27907]EGW30000.1 hypothetical protein SPAPADRAFT_63627 [Spathaspora passalidarum NRRL Y-27907]
MKYPSEFTPVANKQELCKQYVGKSIKELPTPSIVIDRSQFRANCRQMIENAKKLNADFRPHIKTHKTVEGCIEQLGDGEVFTDRIVVSTMMEAWGVLQIPQVQDVHYSLPVVKSRIPEFASFSSRVSHFRLMLDQIEQLEALAAYREANPSIKKWSIFIKVDMGTHRAGLPVGDELGSLLQKALKDPRIKTHVEIYGLYCHAGHSYSSTSEKMAKDFLIDEINFANDAALLAKSLDPSLQLVLSVGATPTANASSSLTNEELLEKLHNHKLEGKLELHAGNYSCCDLQQLATGCITQATISLTVLSEIVSTYPGRGDNAPGEQLIDAGVLALAREFSAIPGHGKVIEPKGFGEWTVGRLSQEHGVLTPSDSSCKFIPYGTQVRVIPQHACIAAAAHPFFFVVGDDNTVVDVWVPLRGW